MCSVVLIVPLLKSKVKDPASSGNYRPIAIATALSKVLEKVVLHRLEAYLYTLDNQFSYKKGLGIDIFVYLGHVISHDMTDDDDIIKQTTKLLVMGNTVQRKFSYCSREVKIELFRSHCYSIYCNSLWSQYKMATMNRLKVCHNDILKRLLGLPRWCSSSLAFARNGVNNLDVTRRHSVFSLRSRVELSTNSIINSVRQSSPYVCGPIQQWWLGLLFVQNELSDEELFEMERHNKSEAGPESEDAPVTKAFTTKQLSEMIDVGRHLAEMAVEYDPQLDRALDFKANILDTLRRYEELYQQKKASASQMKISHFFKPKSLPTPPPSTSGPSTSGASTIEQDMDDPAPTSASRASTEDLSSSPSDQGEEEEL
ncbi:hypothetical protein GWK47_004856 [Chionoecetes opilio]|uniref:Uncharacterized protein n=1 Tax=Chionoecetes opilio TaxID=41210 RepID=A0A8J5D0C8_CHIOP|nr:hypothetical protein GWK47_004856 [Chionoecetes opilio]